MRRRSSSKSKTKSFASKGAHSNVTSIEEEDDIYIRPSSGGYDNNIEVAKNMKSIF